MQLFTTRLQLRELTLQDYGFFYDLEINQKCLVNQEISEPPKEKINDKFYSGLNDILITPRKRFSLIMCEISSGKQVGRIVLWCGNEIDKTWKIAWFVHPDYWGHGYAPEAAQALIEFGFKNLDINEVQAVCSRKNVSSQHVIKKIGMKRDGFFKGISWFEGTLNLYRVYSMRK